jgi:chorismate mutase
MRLDKKKLAFLAACSIFATDRVYRQNTIDKLQPLVETSAQRLAIAEQVALAKWESGMPVDDVPREERVIVSAIRAGESRGLDQTAVFSTHCWQSGVGSAKRQITRRPIWPTRFVRS